jgi:hypothetical protein
MDKPPTLKTPCRLLEELAEAANPLRGGRPSSFSRPAELVGIAKQRRSPERHLPRCVPLMTLNSVFLKARLGLRSRSTAIVLKIQYRQIIFKLTRIQYSMKMNLDALLFGAIHALNLVPARQPLGRNPSFMLCSPSALWKSSTRLPVAKAHLARLFAAHSFARRLNDANLRPVTKDEAKKLGAAPGTLFAAIGLSRAIGIG